MQRWAPLQDLWYWCRRRTCYAANAWLQLWYVLQTFIFPGWTAQLKTVQIIWCLRRGNGYIECPHPKMNWSGPQSVLHWHFPMNIARNLIRPVCVRFWEDLINWIQNLVWIKKWTMKYTIPIRGSRVCLKASWKQYFELSRETSYFQPLTSWDWRLVWNGGGLGLWRSGRAVRSWPRACPGSWRFCAVGSPVQTEVGG